MKLTATLLVASASSPAAVDAFRMLPRVARAALPPAVRTVRGGALRMSTTAAAATTNPLLAQEGLPKFGSVGAEHVKPAVEALLAKLSTDFDALEAKLSAAQDLDGKGAVRYEDVLHELEVLEAPLEYAWGVVGHLTGVMNGDELRQVHQEMQGAVVSATTRLSQSQAVYAGLQAIAANAGEKNAQLDEAQHRVVQSSLKGMALSGVGLAGAAQAQFNANRVKLSGLGTAYANNLLDATKAFGLTLTRKADVEGLPPSALSLAATMHREHVKAAAKAAAKAEEGEEAAKEEGEEEEVDAEAGPWRLGLDMPSYLPAMKFLKSREVREKLYRAFATRAGEANAPLVSEILSLKREQAKLLGFNSYAEVSLERKMAADVGAVAALTEQLLAKAKPAAVKELAALTAFAQAEGFQGDTLALWDVTYWSERQSEALFGFEEEELRPYFALPNVLQGLFGLCHRLFGVTITAANDEGVEVWHEDVQFFKVVDDASGAHVASFYLDPYSRPATKRGGAWMAVCRGKSSVLPGRERPVAYLTCNGSPPNAGKPSLMTFSEVTTLFHEMGHGLQHMLTTVLHAPAAGIGGVEWDAVELPSQFMENWCYDEATVYGSGLAVHYATGEPLPRPLFAKLKEQHTYNAGLVLLRQLYFGALDMALHGDYDPKAEGSPSPFELQASLAEEYTVTPPLKEDKFLCAFGHIFAGGYSAGYYSYKWAEVLSADAFAAFEEVGLDNEAGVRATGRLFRDTVLARGGGQHPSEVFRAFRDGKDPSPEALLRHSGLL